MSTAGRDAVIMDGTAVRDALMSRLRTALVAAGSPPVTLATVLVGDDAPSRAYVRSKHAAAAAVGISSIGVELASDTSQRRLADEVSRLAEDPAVHGILVQMPLPGGLDPGAVLALVPPDKDVDGLTDVSLGRLVRGERGHVGCTPLGVMRLLEHHAIPTAGARAVVLGRSTLVGLPMTLLLARRGTDATVTIAHSQSRDLVDLCRGADIIVSATGVARSITADHVAPGATVIDVGISRTEAGIVGDVDFEAVRKVAGAVTPMPGGTGPMTVACLMENTVEAARMQGVPIPEH